MAVNVIKGELKAAVPDYMQYMTYVFEVLDEEYRSDNKYIMCVRCPNWDCDTLNIGDIGYVHFEVHKAGKDEWWDGNKMVKYNYDFTQFIKFVPEPKPEDMHKYVM